MFHPSYFLTFWKSSSANRFSSPTSGSQVVRRIASLAEKSCWRFFKAHPSPRNLTIIGITSPSVDRTQDLYAYTLILKVSINNIEINIIFWVIKCKDQPQPQPAGVIMYHSWPPLYRTHHVDSCLCIQTSTRWASDSHGLTTYRTTSSHPQSSKSIQRTCQKKSLEKKHGSWRHMAMDQYLLIQFLDIFSGMNSHLPAILMWTTGVPGFDTLPYFSTTFTTEYSNFIIHQWCFLVICFCATGAIFFWMALFDTYVGSAGTKKSAKPPVFPTGRGIQHSENTLANSNTSKKLRFP